MAPWQTSSNVKTAIPQTYIIRKAVLPAKTAVLLSADSL